MLLLGAPVLSGAIGCSTPHLPVRQQDCNLHTYINLVLPDYVKQRYGKDAMPRMAVIPFDVPETFAPPGNESRHFGRELAQLFTTAFHSTGAITIVELFNRDRWPGKREEFFTGNFGAMQIARAAGYDLVLVGYLKDLTNDTDLVLLTRLIDTASQVTIWSGETKVHSEARDWRYLLSKLRLAKDRPELFEFPERARALASCTVEAITDTSAEPTPQ